jgi:drug/metabolite transporter (DMT)-like permease
MITKKTAFMLMIVVTLFTSLAQVFLKFGADKLEINIISLLSNYNLWLGFAFYGGGFVVLMIALKGGDVSSLYPIIATSYIWVAILSLWLFNESISVYGWLAITIIFVGILFVIKGSAQDTVQEVV